MRVIDSYTFIINIQYFDEIWQIYERTKIKIKLIFIIVVN